MPRWIVPLGAASFIAAGFVLRRHLTKPALPPEAGHPARYQFKASPKTQNMMRVPAVSSAASEARTEPASEKHELWLLGAGKTTIHGLSALWTKMNNDWVLNLAAMLAYNLLMSIVPILAMLLSFFGLFLSGLAPGSEQQFVSQMSAAIPGGRKLIEPALQRLADNSGVFAIITIILSAWFGSRLFVTIEQCFGVIFRLPPRGFIRQNLIALVMMLLFVLLIPVLLAVSVAPSFLSTNLVDHLLGDSLAGRIWLMVATGLAGLVIASLLFLVIYAVMPNRPLRIQDAWRGALIAGALLEIYVIAFPFYATLVLKPDSYGSTAGFAVLVLVFFYYFGVILLAGAEINSFWAGQRHTATALPGILYEVQVRKSVEGAAGPTAGEILEDLQADRTGLDLTMTLAHAVLHPPTEAEEKQRVLQRERLKRQTV
jgi:membrane protein